MEEPYKPRMRVFRTYENGMIPESKATLQKSEKWRVLYRTSTPVGSRGETIA
jgi:hypothetical protein